MPSGAPRRAAERQRQLRKARQSGDAEHAASPGCDSPRARPRRRWRAARCRASSASPGRRRCRAACARCARKRARNAVASATCASVTSLRPREALLHAGPERRLEALDQGAVAAPGFAALQVAKAQYIASKPSSTTSTRRRAAEHRLDPHRAARAAPRSPRARAAPRGRSARAGGCARPQRRRIRAEQHLGDAREGRHVAREPAAGVEARREIHARPRG